MEETPEAALRRAEKAIKELGGATSADKTPSKLANAAVALVCLTTIGLLVTHTFFEKDAPKVDGTTALLLAVLLIAPFVRHLKVLELGGAKAEFQQSTASGLSGVVEALKMVNDAIKRIYQDLAQQAVEHETRAAAVEPLADSGVARPLRKILWVDFNTERTTYERDDLGKVFDVTDASTDEAALTALRDDDIDAVVIAQPSRGFDIAKIMERSGPRPVIIYAPPEIPVSQPGAYIVTSYSELTRTIRRLARMYFDELVLRQVRTVSDNITQNPDGIDYIVELPNQKRIAVETPHWHRAPKPESLKARYEKLSAAVRAGAVHGAVLVTQIPDRTKSRSDSVGKPADVQLVELNRLGETLKQF